MGLSAAVLGRMFGASSWGLGGEDMLGPKTNTPGDVRADTLPESHHQSTVPVGWIDSRYEITPAQKPLSALCPVRWKAFGALGLV